jgi:fumarate reductase subunit D
MEILNFSLSLFGTLEFLIGRLVLPVYSPFSFDFHRVMHAFKRRRVHIMLVCYSPFFLETEVIRNCVKC